MAWNGNLSREYAFEALWKFRPKKALFGLYGAIVAFSFPPKTPSGFSCSRNARRGHFAPKITRAFFRAKKRREFFCDLCY